MSLPTEILNISSLLSKDLLRQVVSMFYVPFNEVGTSTRSPNIIVDLGVYLLFTFVSLCFILFLRRCILNPLATYLVTDQRDVGRFGDSATEFVLYFLFSLLGLSCVVREQWLWPSTEWWPIEQATMSNSLRCWYLLDAARYTASLISLIYFEHKRKDFIQMFVHHVVTVVITVLSYHTDFNRVGAIVKLVMDPADVPLHAAKLFKYSSQEFLADRCFELFAISFFITRLVMYAYVVHASTFESIVHRKDLAGPGYVCISGLWILYGLQVWCVVV